MKEPKQLAYWYDTILAEDETEIGPRGETEVPAKGDTRKRHGITYKVVFVRTFRPADSTIRIYQVFLKEVGNALIRDSQDGRQVGIYRMRKVTSKQILTLITTNRVLHHSFLSLPCCKKRLWEDGNRDGELPRHFG